MSQNQSGLILLLGFLGILFYYTLIYFGVEPTQAIIGILLIAAPFLVAGIWLEAVNRQQAFSVSRRRKPTRDLERDQSRKYSGDTISPHLFQELMALTHDKKTAMRLVKHVATNNPQWSLNTCAQKAIRDLERDRR